jgi:NAD(P)-dependent dehydrogenase (short-subunit alcohol dehydrogenase family)
MTLPLTGRIALVAGATRGAGRGIARMLGEAGATVYCSGRSSRSTPRTHHHRYAGRPETIEETAELVTAAGGEGIAVRVDHTVESEVAALFERIEADQAGRLDILVNILTGPAARWGTPFWKMPLVHGHAMLDGWIWPHIVTAWHASRLMTARRSGLIIEITELHTLAMHGGVFFDLVITTHKRLAYDLGEELAEHGVSALTVVPGFMRTEAILDHFGATVDNWGEIARSSKAAREFGFAGSETPAFVGRAVAALAADPHVADKNGGLFSSWSLAEEYGFTDIDGRRPHWERYGAEHFPQLMNPQPKTGRRWRIDSAR